MHTPYLLTALALAFPLSLQAASDADSTIVVQNDSISQTLGEATVKATRLFFVTKKDTLVYDIQALNSTRGDMLEDIIGRLPGLDLRDGVLYFKGKRVNRLQVNGTDFAKGDTKTALSVLPAYIIKKVKAYEGQTEQHRITGIDDGEKEQVVDVILRKEYLGTWTGNTDLGYGTDERWRARAFANTFTDRMRISVYGGFTNTGQYQNVQGNGSWSDNGGAGASSGDTKYYRPGLSFMWKNKDDENATGFFKVEGSGGWDYRGHKDYNENRSENFLSDGTSQFSSSDTRMKDDEKIWNANLAFTWRPWKDMYINFNPRYVQQHQTNRSHARSGLWNENVEKAFDSPLDSLAAHRTDGWPTGQAVNLVLEESKSRNVNDFYGHWLYATQKLNSRNLRLSLRQSLNYSQNTYKKSALQSYSYFQSTAQSMDPLYNRFTDKDDSNYFNQTFLDLNIPVPFLETVSLTYGYEKKKEDCNQAGYRLERMGGIFADFDRYNAVLGLLPTEVDWRQACRDAEITLNSNTLMRRHWAEAKVQYNRNGLYVSVQNLLKFRHDELDYLKGDNDPVHPRRNATEYLLNSRLRYKSKKSGNYQVGFYHDDTPQDISNYITIPDRSNPLSISLGNPDLKKTQHNQFSAQFDHTFPKNRYIQFAMQTDWYRNFTVTSATYDKSTGVTTSQPVNMNGQWTLAQQAYFGTPLDSKQRAFLSGFLSYNFSHTPNLTLATEGQPWKRTNKTHGIYANLAVNVNWTKFNLNLSANGGYNRLRSTDASVDGLDKWDNSYKVYFKATLPWDMELKNDFTVWQHISARSLNSQPTFCIWNILLSKSILKERNMSLQLECSDLFNQRKQVWSGNSATSSYWGRSMVVGRFFMFHVVYNFSTKKKG